MGATIPPMEPIRALTEAQRQRMIDEIQRVWRGAGNHYPPQKPQRPEQRPPPIEREPLPSERTIRIDEDEE